MAWLDDKDKLVLRSVCRSLRDVMVRLQEAPYHTRVQFAIATTSIYKTKEEFESAWISYHKTMISQDTGPAVLYKLNELTREALNFIADTDLGDSQRRYTPTAIHTWRMNQAWVLAQFHKGRGFVVCAKATMENLQHKCRDGYSAFAKELTAAIKVGYQIHLSGSHGKTQVQLLPPKQSLLPVTIHQITMTDEEIKKGGEQVLCAQESLCLKPHF